jgi:mannonate dehydratase
MKRSNLSNKQKKGESMKLSFRWFGINDPVPLGHIRQIPAVSTIVTQVPEKQIGEILPENQIKQYKDAIEKAGMKFEVYESLAVHPAIKLGTEERDYFIEIYKKNIAMLAGQGIKVIVYNFRPIFRWARTDIAKVLADASTVSAFSKNDSQKIDPFINTIETSAWHRDNSGFIYKRQLTTDLDLKGYYIEESTEILKKLRHQYLELGKEGLWKNLEYFIQSIVPTAEEYGVKMAIHPDDPPWDIFGVPRLITGEQSIERVLGAYDSPANGLVFCSGTLGSSPRTDVVALARRYSAENRIPFAHIRNVLHSEEAMEECAHYSECGSLDMVELLKAFHDNDYQGYIRPDHGRMIWGEEGQSGNGIFDRALGAQYILGIWETLGKL